MEPEGPAGDDPDARPAQKRYGIGAVDYHTGETVVLVRRRKRRPEVAELLEALLEKHPTGRLYVAWDNSNTHEDDEIEAMVCGAAGRLVLLYLPTYSPWLNPIEMLWRHFRREVIHCELFPSIPTVIVRAGRSMRDYTFGRPESYFWAATILLSEDVGPRRVPHTFRCGSSSNGGLPRR